jgi:hypothetical protein
MRNFGLLFLHSSITIRSTRETQFRLIRMEFFNSPIISCLRFKLRHEICSFTPLNTDITLILSKNDIRFIYIITTVIISLKLKLHNYLFKSHRIIYKKYIRFLIGIIVIHPSFIYSRHIDILNYNLYKILFNITILIDKSHKSRHRFTSNILSAHRLRVTRNHTGIPLLPRIEYERVNYRID